ncbi:MAG: pantoate--beta-alanine ligase [Thermodesulfovibrionales bacterium]|nr:pantoate--beta-alanine ligase [Thermodesulfovibrionales bacterium]
MPEMRIITGIKEMQECTRDLIMKGKDIGFVPTMGALHEGHMSLVRQAKRENDIVVVSVFVNPLQFGPNEDFARYPRDLEGDSEKLKKESVDILFNPDTKEMYPEGYRTHVEVHGISDKLCGAFRPGHFRGVATVVTKLFNIVKPKRAYFGLKDYQQTVIIKKMVRDLNMDVEIITCPTVREPDGLAMSSRNLYLKPDERRAATVIYRTLIEASQLVKELKPPEEVQRLMFERLKGEPLVSSIDYAGLYDPETLEEIKDYSMKKEILIAIALRIGQTRLIDNILISQSQ